MNPALVSLIRAMAEAAAEDYLRTQAMQAAPTEETRSEPVGFTPAHRAA